MARIVPSLTIVWACCVSFWILTSNKENRNGEQQRERREEGPRHDQRDGGTRGVEGFLRGDGYPPQGLRTVGREGPGAGVDRGRQGRPEEEGRDPEEDGRVGGEGPAVRADHQHQRPARQRRRRLEFGEDRSPGQDQPRPHDRQAGGGQGDRQEEQQPPHLPGSLETHHPQEEHARPSGTRDMDAGRPIYIRVCGAVFDTRCPSNAVSLYAFA